MKIKYNQQIEVNALVYKIIEGQFSWLFARRKQKGVYYIKLMISKYESYANELFSKIVTK